MPASYTIKGIAPFDLQQYPDAVRLMYWSWIVTLGLKAKDRDLAEGLDAFGEPLRAISKETRKHRKSAMTPTGKGDPSAPPLSPGRKLSRVRSLLAGRALVDRAEFHWRFDPFTHATFARILTYQQEQGRDVFGLSDESTEEVRLAALRRWRTWLTTGAVVPAELVGKRVVAPLAATGTTGPVPTKRGAFAGHKPTEVAVFGIGGEPGTGAPIRGFSEAEFKAFYRQTMPANVQARPGREYNRILRHIWGEPPARPRGGVTVPKPPKPPPVIEPPRPGQFTEAAHVEAWAKRTFPNATLEHEGVPVSVWNDIADEMDFLSRKHPEVASRLTYIGTKSPLWAEGAKDAYQYAAAADPDYGRRIAFNPTHWQDLSKTRKNLAGGEQQNWHPKGVTDPRSHVTHEWGHLVDAWLNNSNAITKEATSVWRSIRNPFLESPNSLDQKVDPSKAVSRYANTNHFEAVAEAFSALRWQPENLWTGPLRQFKAALETAIELARKAGLPF